MKSRQLTPRQGYNLLLAHASLPWPANCIHPIMLNLIRWLNRKCDPNPYSFCSCPSPETVGGTVSSAADLLRRFNPHVVGFGILDDTRPSSSQMARRLEECRPAADQEIPNDLIET